ncbi:MAG: DUF485 domain-containing protein [Planctomycetaceae bacterium]|nr:DUF485 domain-containing protein [Planctomycetaceae bacterium]
MPNAPHHDDHPDVSAANARAGLVLFFVYLAAYAGFMGLAAFAPQAMGTPVLAGVNLAITYGMGLIVGALVVAAIYMWICGRNARGSLARGPRAPRAEVSARGARRPQGEAGR